MALHISFRAKSSQVSQTPGPSLQHAHRHTLGKSRVSRVGKGWVECDGFILEHAVSKGRKKTGYVQESPKAFQGRFSMHALDVSISFLNSDLATHQRSKPRSLRREGGNFKKSLEPIALHLEDNQQRFSLMCVRIYMHTYACTQHACFHAYVCLCWILACVQVCTRCKRHSALDARVKRAPITGGLHHLVCGTKCHAYIHHKVYIYVA